jgi:hypothetical protein
VPLVRVQLGPSRIADHPESVGDAQPAVARVGDPRRAIEPVLLEAEPGEREGPADGEQDRVTLRRRAVVELDDMGARTALAPVRTWTPSRSSAARTVSAFRGWSCGISRGPDWTIAVGTPKRA